MGRPQKEIKYKLNEKGCHICTSHSYAANHRYPTIYRGKAYRMSRYIYEQNYGLIPEGKIVRHICDNEECINSKHLIVGTQADNMRDAVIRNRIARGEKASHTKLTSQQVKNIRESNLSGQSIAQLYNVHPSTIYEIRQKRTWAHIN